MGPFNEIKQKFYVLRKDMDNVNMYKQAVGPIFSPALNYKFLKLSHFYF